MTLTMSDNGRDLSVSVGDVVTVELEFQGGTGYSWNVEGLDETHLKLIDTKTRNISKEGIIGGPVLGVWCFKAAAPGDTVLSMQYYRVWEKKESVLKSFSVRLHIADKK